VSPDALRFLACPACGGSLTQGSDGPAACGSCGRGYPTRDGILNLALGGLGAPGYDPHYFRSIPQVEERHFWFVARRETILRGLRRVVPDLEARPLFDVGCGTGGLLAFLERSGLPVAGACDAYVEGLRVARKRLSAPLVLTDEGRLPPLATGQRLVGLFDVLEHIDDDRGTLRFLRSVLEPGGVLVLTVPAHPFLFDEMDALAHHRRRYRRRDLRVKLEEAGFQVLLLEHFMGLLMPLLVGLRAAGRLLSRPDAAPRRRRAELTVVPGVNGLLLAALRLEGALHGALPVPFGSSLLAVARRPE
jgi:SAM-dependent methyltransferase